MNQEQYKLPRRAFVTAALAGVLIPRSVFAQVIIKPDPSRGIDMRIRCTFASHTFTATLFDSPSVRDFVSMIPLDLDIEDYSTNEKIAYLPRKLTEDGSAPFSNEAPGDLCYYAPWGNLAFFHGSYRYSKGLIRLGRLDDGHKPLLTRGKFTLRIVLHSTSTD